MKYQVIETVELAPGAEANVEVLCNVRDGTGLWNVNVSKEEVVIVFVGQD